MRCPAVVIGHASKQVFIKHAVFLHRVNPIHLQHVNQKRLPKETVCSDGDNSLPICSESVGMEDDNSHDLDENVEDDNSHDLDENVENIQTSSSANLESESVISMKNPTTESGIVPEIGSLVRYKLKDYDDFHDAKILSRAGKASTVKRTWLNIDDLHTGEKMSVDFKKVEMWKYPDVPDQSYQEVLLVSEADDVVTAKFKEVENLKEHSVFKEVDYVGQPLIDTRWIVTEKVKDGRKYSKLGWLLKASRKWTKKS